MRFVIAFYELDRHFGGPEEGGWWYDAGTLARVFRVCTSETIANAHAARANSLLARVQRHRRHVGSVLYDGGRFSACVFERTAPEAFPAVRPRYE